MARLRSDCIECLLKKELGSVPEELEEDRRREYLQRLLSLIGSAPEKSSVPLLQYRVSLLKKEYFESADPYSLIKRHFNSVMLKREEPVWQRIQASEEPLSMALRYAMTGNFIDFGAMKNVDEEKLTELLDSAGSLKIDPGEYSRLKEELSRAGSLVLLTDNCGEIVMDKLLLRQIARQYPGLSVSVIVRGAPAINDATLEDARQVGLTEEFSVMGSGSAVAGTELELLSPEALSAIESADIILSKGQGNFESLHHCGLNIFYIFLCKCSMFAEKFHVPVLSGVLASEAKVAREQQL